MTDRAGQEEPAVRPSTLVDRSDLPGVRAREEINILLRAHDPEVPDANLDQLTDRHSPLLRQIANDRQAYGRDPSLRRNAINALGRIISVENLNLLTELATRDDDEAIRTNALIALANTGLSLAVPLLADAQDSGHPVEAAAARKGLSTLADRLGTDTVEAALRSGQRRIGPPDSTGGATTSDTAGS